MSTRKREQEASKEQIKLDSKDQSIIGELTKNSSQSATEISEKTGISKQVVGYRIKDLIKKGVIKQCNQVIDAGLLGYQLFDVFLQYRGTVDEEELMKTLDEKENIVSYSTLMGIHDLKIRAWAKDNLGLKEILSELNDTDGANGSLETREILFVAETEFFGMGKNNRAGFSLKPGNRDTDKKEKIPLDKKDAKILSMLAEDSRTNLKEMAKSTKLSSNAIRHRIKSLKTKGLVAGNTTSLDEDKTGKVKGLLLLKKKEKSRDKNREREKAMCQYLKKTEIRRKDTYAGKWDLGIELSSGSDRELRETGMEILNLFSDIISEHTMLKVVSEGEKDYFPFRQEERWDKEGKRRKGKRGKT